MFANASAGTDRGTVNTTRIDQCPSCGTDSKLHDFYELDQVPVHSVLLMNSREEALNYPTRDMRLTLCRHCGFIFNRLFDPTVHEYSERYEETQGYSETFNAFSNRLSEQLIDRHGIRNKRVIEIGCGKGEFLTHLCETGGNTGVGFDPAYVADRSRARPSERVTFVPDFYSERYASYSADFVCCKMTLEHISDTGRFVRMIRRTLGSSPDTIVFFQVPDVTRILEEAGFWDIYYEHCSYFTPVSICHLFEASGFQVLDVWNDYDGQYLMIEAIPSRTPGPGRPPVAGSLNGIHEKVQAFADKVHAVTASWIGYLNNMHTSDRNIVLWGGGSKAVAFLSTLKIASEVLCAIDINPNKHDTYLPGTGHRVVSPEALLRIKPDAVIMMNPVYRVEIQEHLTSQGINPDLISVSEPPVGRYE